MKLGFYPRLAWGGIVKNKRLYVPYILSASGVAAVFYIMFYLASGSFLDGMVGGSTAAQTLSLGVYVIVVFALIFLFYCNSFLVRRRYKEFGLYSILGMNKRNITRVLIWETLFCALLSLAGGIVVGALLSKLAEMLMARFLGGTADYALHISLPAIEYMFIFFGIIFALILLNSIIRVMRMTATELVRSENYGEKPVKANPVLGIAGVVLLGAAYYLAVSIDQPVKALMIFFAAVIMVIIGTYLLFIAGSVMLCRALQKNKRYYYKPNHFVSVASMTYRMKRNGAGLASICILATMVLVMISSTSCLYFGMLDLTNARYPRDIDVTVGYTHTSDASVMSEEKIGTLRDKLVSALGDTERKNVLDFRQAGVTGAFKDGTVDISENYTGSDVLHDANVRLVPLSDYNRAAGTNEILGEGEAIVHTLRCDYDLKTVSLGDALTFTVKKTVDTMPLVNGSDAADIVPTVTLVVADFDKSTETLLAAAGDGVVRMQWHYDFDCSDDIDEQEKVTNKISGAVESEALSSEEPDVWSYLVYDSRAAERAFFAGSFGGLFFLGILLSAVFICAAVLIIYYKQLSEGYEDAHRFEIMQKVGMTKQEIRRSINSQLLTVFFLPLIFAGLHLSFAFPFIRKILYLFAFYNTSFLVWTTVISFCVFALIYAAVYKKTSNTYYKIVTF